MNTIKNSMTSTEKIIEFDCFQLNLSFFLQQIGSIIPTVVLPTTEIIEPFFIAVELDDF